MIFDNIMLRNLHKIKDKLSYTQNSHGCSECTGFTHCMIYNDKTFCKHCIDKAILERKGFMIIKLKEEKAA